VQSCACVSCQRKLGFGRIYHGKCNAMAFGNWNTAKAEKKVDTTTSHAESMHEIKQLPVSSASSGAETHTHTISFGPRASPVTYFYSYTFSALAQRDETGPWSFTWDARHRNFRNGSRHGRPECDMCKTHNNSQTRWASVAYTTI
jgi:hypothetical protein